MVQKQTDIIESPKIQTIKDTADKTQQRTATQRGRIVMDRVKQLDGAPKDVMN